MKILVPVKRVIDYNVRIRIKADGSGVETEGVKHAINPFDEIALEEAIRLREKGVAREVVAVSIGAATSAEVLRHALALGADRAILVTTEKPIEPLHAAKILQVICAREQPQLILMGKQAIDDDANQTGQMLAGLLGVGQATFASALEFPPLAPPASGVGTEILPTPLAGGARGGQLATSSNPSIVHVTREIDGGLQTLALTLPCVITADLRLNTPRYASLPNIMKAKSKPLETIAEQDLGVNHTQAIRQLKVEEPPKRKRGVMVANVEELVAKLKQEARVI